MSEQIEKKSKAEALTREDLLAAIRELKAPSAKELAKEEEEQQREAARRKQMIELATEEMKAKVNRQRACGHVKQNGDTLFQGQIHSDGLYHPICMRCGKEGTPQEPPKELLAQGVA